jgi:hypothetical protein
MLAVEQYERLEAAAAVVARHATFSTKNEVVRSCVRDVEQRFESGVLSYGQRVRLIAILLGQNVPD